jgi:zinc protease
MIALVLLATVMTMNEAPKPASPDLLPFEATEKTLANGLKVIVVPTGLPNIVSVQIPVQTGSRNEVEPGKSGFAHFFEHMMFRGTPQVSPDEYQAILTRAGARSNAYTSDDLTNYHTTFAKEDLETILRIEADRFQNLAYAEAAFKTEARAVLGEYNKNSAEPVNKLIEVQREAAYSRHTYKHTTMGFIRDIEDMPNQFDYSKTFFERWYRPEHTTVIVAGDVVPAEALRLVEKHWGGWKPGRYSADIPAEPAPSGPVYAHVPWPSETLPLVTVAFHGPAFSARGPEFAAIDLGMDLTFGPTSDLYRRLVEQEQQVDQLFFDASANKDPGLMTVGARVKDPADAVYVRDEILKAFARVREEALAEKRVADAKSNARYRFAASLDSTERVAATLAFFVSFERRYATLNEYYRVYERLTPADVQAAARKYFSDEGMVVTTLSHQPLPAAVATLPPLAGMLATAGVTAGAGDAAAGPKVIAVPSQLPQLNVKLLFRAGAAHDPKGKEGLGALAAAMIAEAGSKARPIDQIREALFPMAGAIGGEVDKEMTTFTLSVHRDNWDRFADLVLPMLTEPGFREEDFRRLKDQQRSALTQDLRNNNEEELGKERLQETVFRGTPYGHVVLGTVAGIQSITLDDVKAFAKGAYTRANLTVGLGGDAPPAVRARLDRALAALPAGPALPAPSGVAGRKAAGLQVEIVQKDTRATAISLGHPIEVTRSHPDFAALSVARAWLGEHRSSMARLFQRIRQERGMNYGDYAYIEAFPRGMFQFFPDANVARRAQLFEIWIRPVVPENAHMAIRIALHELQQLIEKGLSAEDFEATRNYLMKNVYLLTARQEQQVGYRLDSDWYGIPEYTAFLRQKLSGLTAADVNAAVRRHLSARDLFVVVVTRDAQALKERLLSDAFSPIEYDGEKPAELLAEDRVIGARKLGLRPDAVTVTPVEEVFAR